MVGPNTPECNPEHSSGKMSSICHTISIISYFEIIPISGDFDCNVEVFFRTCHQGNKILIGFRLQYYQTSYDKNKLATASFLNYIGGLYFTSRPVLWLLVFYTDDNIYRR